MSDNKKKKKQDRLTISLTEPYEVAFVQQKFGVTKALVRQAVKAVGNRRRAVYDYLRAHLRGEKV